MCVVLLLLVGAASCARPLLPSGQLYRSELQASSRYELQPPLSRGEPYVDSVERSRPSYESFAHSHKVEEKSTPSLRTDIRSSYEIEGDHGAKINKNGHYGNHAALQEPAKGRSSEAARRRELKETPVDNKFKHSDDEDEQESTWVWGSSDPPAESTNTTAVNDLDDRTSIDGANCPTGQVKVDGKCVDKH